MKIKVQIIKAFFFILCSNLLVMNAFTQDSYIKDRWNFKAGYSRYNTSAWLGQERITVGHYRIETNYGLFNKFELGVYLGYSRFEFIYHPFSYKEYNTPFYGVNVNFHLFPFLIKRNDFRFDLYGTGKFGGLYYPTPEGSYFHGHVNEYGMGGGFAFYFWDHVGAFAEYCFGKYYYEDNTNLRYGLTFKFK